MRRQRLDKIKNLNRFESQISSHALEKVALLLLYRKKMEAKKKTNNKNSPMWVWVATFLL